MNQSVQEGMNSWNKESDEQKWLISGIPKTNSNQGMESLKMHPHRIKEKNCKSSHDSDLER